MFYFLKKIEGYHCAIKYGAIAALVCVPILPVRKEILTDPRLLSTKRTPSQGYLPSVCFADMLQLINTEDGDFPGLFEASFGTTVTPEPNPHGPSLFSGYLEATNSPSSSLFQVPAPPPPSFQPVTAANSNTEPTPMDIKEEPVLSTASQPASRLPPTRMAAQSFVPAPQTQFSAQPMVGFLNQSSVSGEEGGPQA